MAAHAAALRVVHAVALAAAFPAVAPRASSLLRRRCPIARALLLPYRFAESCSTPHINGTDMVDRDRPTASCDDGALAGVARCRAAPNHGAGVRPPCDSDVAPLLLSRRVARRGRRLRALPTWRTATPSAASRAPYCTGRPLCGQLHPMGQQAYVPDDVDEPDMQLDSTTTTTWRSCSRALQIVRESAARAGCMAVSVFAREPLTAATGAGPDVPARAPVHVRTRHVARLAPGDSASHVWAPTDASPAADRLPAPSLGSV